MRLDLAGLEEIIEQYGGLLAPDEIFIAIERAFAAAFKKDEIVIDWGEPNLYGELSPVIFVLDSRAPRPVSMRSFNKIFLSKVAGFLREELELMVFLKKVKKIRTRLVQKAVAGVVRQIDEEENWVVEIDSISEPFRCICLKQDQIPKERTYDVIDKTLVFYVKKILLDDNNRPVVYLSRVSKTLTTLILSEMAKSAIASFKDKVGRNPVLFCTHRISGYISFVSSEVLIAKESLEMAAKLAGDDVIDVQKV